MVDINYNKCMALKNKNSSVQCPYLRKNSNEYCGIHCRSKKFKRIDGMAINVDLIISTNKPKIKIIETIYSNDDMLMGFNKLRKKNILNTLIYFKIYDTNSKKKTNKRQLYLMLHNYFESVHKFKKYEDLILKIQTCYRRYNIYKRNKSTNDTDLLHLETHFLIPTKLKILFLKYCSITISSSFCDEDSSCSIFCCKSFA